MPLSKTGNKVLSNMQDEYGEDKGKSVFYASINKGRPGSDKWEGQRNGDKAAKAKMLRDMMKRKG